MTREEYEEESRKIDEECRVEAERHQKAIVSLVDRRIQLKGSCMKGCINCKHEAASFDGYCYDCWPRYDLCAACTDYRCEHMPMTKEDLENPESFSCHCEHPDCRAGFVEGNKDRVVHRRIFEAMTEAWGYKPKFSVKLYRFTQHHEWLAPVLDRIRWWFERRQA